MTNETQTTQHTPAPWGWYDAWEDSEGIHSPRLGRVEAGDRRTIVESRGADLVVSEPDARLIAAAPKMLAALEAYISLMESGSVIIRNGLTDEAEARCHEVALAADAAIAEARR
jgi:hypothetical protein